MKLPTIFLYGMVCLILTHCQRAQQSGGPGYPPVEGSGSDSRKPLDDAPKGIDDLTGEKSNESVDSSDDQGEDSNDGSSEDIDNENSADNLSVDDILNNNGADNPSTRINNDVEDLPNQGGGGGTIPRVNPTPTPPLNNPPGGNTLGGGTGPSTDGNCKFGATDVRQFIDAAKSSLQPHEILVWIEPKLLVPERRNEASLARVGFLKALFHTSFAPQMGGFTDVSDGNCAVYKIDLQAVWGNTWQADWQLVASANPAQDTSFDPARQPWKRPEAQESADIAQRVISAQRLAYNIVYPTNYLRLIKAPGSITRMPQGRTLAAGGYSNGIPCGPRLLQVRESKLPDGTVTLMFTAGDPGSPGEPGRSLPASPPRGGSDMPRAPGRTISASETMQQLANGFFRYFIFRNPGSLGTKALQSGVIDPGNPTGNYHLVVGRSCISCHNNGIRGVPVDTANAGNGWSTGEQMDQYFVQSRDKYKNAMATLVRAVSASDAGFNDKLIHGRTREPIAFLLSAVEGYSARGRPYASCRQAGGDKYSQQLQAQNALVQAQMQGINAPSGDAVPGESIPGGQQNGGAQSGGLQNGAQAYQQYCGSCHPDGNSMRGKPIPASMWSRSGIANDAAAQQAVRSFLGG